MAGSSLLALIDDIATVLDDVALLAKVAAKKTTGVLGDDLALNAEQVAGVRAERELPVVWAVAKGSALNKLILVPVALLISRFAPWLVVPLLMLGGTFLCFEGFEKVAQRFLHPREARPADQAIALAEPGVDPVAFEKEKIRGAVRTDFVLSAEIVTISLGIVAAAPFPTQVLVLSGIAALMTAGVYGVVALIVKLDDIGLYLSRKPGTQAKARFQRSLGGGILFAASRLMKGLAIAGTLAMFLVGGGILGHGMPGLHHLRESLVHAVGSPGSVVASVVPALLDTLIGLVTGALVLGIITLAQRLLPKRKDKAQPRNP